MTSAPKIVAGLEKAGVVLSLDGTAIAFDAPAGVMTEERLYDVRANKTAFRLLLELRVGQEWLTRQHHGWFAGNRHAAPTDVFSRILNDWDSRDYVLRQLYSWDTCIWGPNRRCPDEAVGDCRGCTTIYGEK